MKTVYWIILLAFIVVLSVAALIIFMPGQNATKAQIYSDGQVIRTVDLLVDQQFTVTSPTGGTNVITVEGAACLQGAQHTVMPDRIVAATYLSAVGAAGGEVELSGVCANHLSTVLDVLEGFQVKVVNR